MSTDFYNFLVQWHLNKFSTIWDTYCPQRLCVFLHYRGENELDFRCWGQVTPKVKIFGNGNVFSDSATGHRNTFRDQIWWKSAVAKSPKGRLVYHTKKLALRGTRFSAHFAQNGPIAPKIPERCRPLICPRTPNLVRIDCVLLDLFRKDWFFGPKSRYDN